MKSNIIFICDKGYKNKSITCEDIINDVIFDDSFI